MHALGPVVPLLRPAHEVEEDIVVPEELAEEVLRPVITEVLRPHPRDILRPMQVVHPALLHIRQTAKRPRDFLKRLGGARRVVLIWVEFQR
jgi:hypothetical protein